MPFCVKCMLEFAWKITTAFGLIYSSILLNEYMNVHYDTKLTSDIFYVGLLLFCLSHDSKFKSTCCHCLPKYFVKAFVTFATVFFACQYVLANLLLDMTNFLLEHSNFFFMHMLCLCPGLAIYATAKLFKSRWSQVSFCHTPIKVQEPKQLLDEELALEPKKKLPFLKDIGKVKLSKVIKDSQEDTGKKKVKLRQQQLQVPYMSELKEKLNSNKVS